MVIIFYIASIIAILTSVKVISCSRVDKAILYFVISLLATALIFILLDAYFSLALFVILFIGGVAVVFLYIASFLKMRTDLVENGRHGISPKIWLGPLILAFILLVILIYGIVSTDYVALPNSNEAITAMSINAYILVVELAGFLLLGTAVIVYHFMHSLFMEKSV